MLTMGVKHQTKNLPGIPLIKIKIKNGPIVYERLVHFIVESLMLEMQGDGSCVSRKDTLEPSPRIDEK